MAKVFNGIRSTWSRSAGGSLAVITARGERERVRTITDAMLNWAVPRGVGEVVGFTQHALAMDALANVDWGSAFQRAARISPPGVLQPRVGSSLRVALALVEGACSATTAGRPRTMSPKCVEPASRRSRRGWPSWSRARRQ